MIAVSEGALDDRVVLLAPTRKDSEMTVGLLNGAGITVRACADFDSAFGELSRGAALFVVPEEIIGPAQRAQLSEMLEEQPPWADLPMLILTQSGANSAATEDAVRTLGNVTLLDRPIRLAGMNLVDDAAHDVSEVGRPE